MNRRRVPKDLRDRIEQLIARGHRARVIADRLGVTVDQVAQRHRASAHPAIRSAS